MKQYIRSLVAHPVLTATAAWLVLYGIMVAIQVYQGYDLQGLEVPSNVPLVVIASVVGAGVGTLISRGVMQRRKSLGQRIISAVLSLVLAIIAAFVVGLLVVMVEETLAPPAEPSDRGGSIALGIAICVGGPTGLVFGFTGRALKGQPQGIRPFKQVLWLAVLGLAVVPLLSGCLTGYGGSRTAETRHLHDYVDSLDKASITESKRADPL